MELKFIKHNDIHKYFYKKSKCNKLQGNYNLKQYATRTEV